MKLIEIRDLDGPNIFLLEPAIKIEIAFDAEDESAKALARGFGLPANDSTFANDHSSVMAVIQRAVQRIHETNGFSNLAITVAPLETEGHFVVAYGWSHRRFALAVANAVARVVQGETVDIEAESSHLGQLLKESTTDDSPQMIRDADRAISAIAVTGTNGKTTTTRLISHILRRAAQHVGWCSSSGVYIDGEQVIEGDYSGPSGARRVLTESGLDVGVLETARGGILLRGTAYESNDISVFTNISADHLDLQGIRTVEGLARVKSVVVRVTKPNGVAILNADDPLVMTATDPGSPPIRATVWLVSQQPSNPSIVSHLANGGTALIVEDGSIVIRRGDERRDLIDVDQVPIAYGGKARHMVENALCAAAACLAYGMTDADIANGLASFENSPTHNQGRLNVIEFGEITVVVDYAHNESGLSHLLDFTRLLRKPGGRLISVIGTAGDRTDQSLREIGRVAATESDLVILKGTERYLRGRPLKELLALYSEGVAQAGKAAYATEPDELSAIVRAVNDAMPGDAICIMAQEQIPEILDYLASQNPT